MKTIACLVALMLLGAAGAAGPRAWAGPVYFVVAETGQRIHSDSYLLPLEDPVHIAHARDLILHGPDAGSPIVVARIEKGADGINRDVLSATDQLWSWHVARFDSFADSTIELIDGWPSFVEQDVDAWIANTDGYIGFWQYSVIGEWRPVPEPATALLFLAALAGLVASRAARAVWEAPARLRRVAGYVTR